MKKLFIVSVLIAAPFFVFAQNADQKISSADLQKQIRDLLRQVQTLQRQIATLHAELGKQPETSGPTAPAEEKSPSSALPETSTPASAPTLPELTRTLSRGASGDEVRNLQKFLAQDKDIYPQGFITGFFGPLTEKAVKKWQEKHGIESIGAVGPKTLSKINELISEGAGKSGVVPPGLLRTPGIEKKLGTTTLPESVFPPPSIPGATTTPASATTTLSAIPAQPQGQTGTTTVSATPTTPAQSATTTTTTPPSSTPPPTPSLWPNIRITNAVGESYYPSIAWSGDGFGLVWSDFRGDGVTPAVYFAKLDSQGNKIVNDLKISGTPPPVDSPTILWTGNEFAVVWSSKDDSASICYRYYFQRITAGGVPVGGMVALKGSDGQCLSGLRIVWNGNGYGIAWSTAGRVFFATLDTSGSQKLIQDKMLTSVYSLPYDLVYRNGAYLLWWAQRNESGPNWTIPYLSHLDANGNKTRGDIKIAPSLPATEITPLQQVWDAVSFGAFFKGYDPSGRTQPYYVRFDDNGVKTSDGVQIAHIDQDIRDSFQGVEVVRNGNAIGVVLRAGHDGYQVFFMEISLDGSILSAPQRIDNSVGQVFSADIAWTGAHYAVVWSDSRHMFDKPVGGSTEIYFARIPSSSVAGAAPAASAASPQTSTQTTTTTAITTTATTTSASSDTTPPTISNVQATSITETAAAITWTTNESASGEVYYSIDHLIATTSPIKIIGANNITGHSVGLTGLSSGKTYYYIVVSKDTGGNTATSSEQSFTTAAPPPAALSFSPSVIANFSALSAYLRDVAMSGADFIVTEDQTYRTPTTRLFRVTQDGQIATITSGIKGLYAVGVNGSDIFVSTRVGDLVRVAPDGATTTIMQGVVGRDLLLDIAFSGSDIVVTDFGGGQLLRVTTGGTVSVIASGLRYIHSVVASGQNFIVSHQNLVGNGSLSRVTPDGNVTLLWSFPPNIGYAFAAMTIIGSDIYAWSPADASIYRFTQNGVLVGQAPLRIEEQVVNFATSGSDIVAADWGGKLLRITPSPAATASRDLRAKNFAAISRALDAIREKLVRLLQ